MRDSYSLRCSNENHILGIYEINVCSVSMHDKQQHNLMKHRLILSNVFRRQCSFAGGACHLDHLQRYQLFLD